MKKATVLSLALILLLALSPVSLAESKYDGFTFEQLQTEYLAILQAMWKTDAWQRVEVPAGVYEVGVEIPEGEWTISNSNYFTAVVGGTLDATKTEVDRDSIKAYELVYMEEYKNGWTVELMTGDFIELSKAVYFSVPVKGQGFTFK